VPDYRRLDHQAMPLSPLRTPAAVTIRRMPKVASGPQQEAFGHHLTVGARQQTTNARNSVLRGNLATPGTLEREDAMTIPLSS
jgi:hypothetical protein